MSRAPRPLPTDGPAIGMGTLLILIGISLVLWYGIFRLVRWLL